MAGARSVVIEWGSASSRASQLIRGVRRTWVAALAGLDADGWLWYLQCRAHEVPNGHESPEVGQ